jgi:hypothetical protein
VATARRPPAPEAARTPRRSGSRATSATLLVAALAATACGTATNRQTTQAATHPADRPTTRATPQPKQPSVCTNKATTAVARFLRVSPSAITTTATTSSQAAPECDFRAREKRVTVSVIDDDGPQPFTRLERTAEEATQFFGAARMAPAPQDIHGVGLDADWFPPQQHLMTTDGARLITAAVTWPGSPQRQRIAIAIAVARAYLGPLHPEAANPQ